MVCTFLFLASYRKALDILHFETSRFPTGRFPSVLFLNFLRLPVKPEFSELYLHRRSFPRLALYLYLGVMENRSVLYDGQSESGAADGAGMALVYTIEPFENPIKVFSGDADSRILYGDTRAAVDHIQIQFGFSALLIVFDGVIADIINHFIEHLAHADYLRVISGELQLHMMLGSAHGQVLHHLLAKRIEICFLSGKLI